MGYQRRVHGWSLWNCCPCFDDVGDIILYGTPCEGTRDEVKLTKVFRSKEVFDSLAEIVQEKHADFRLTQRNLGRGVEKKKKLLRPEETITVGSMRIFIT